MAATLTTSEEAQLAQTVEMFEVITQSQPADYQSLEILKEAYVKLGRPADALNTSKRIAEAYVHMGQLSSAILEYETILQRFPGDPDIQKALADIEGKANNFPSETTFIDNPAKASAVAALHARKASDANTVVEVEDGRRTFQKIFVEGRLISAGDFDLYWVSPPPKVADVPEPFIHKLDEKGILTVEHSLKVLSDKSKAAYVSLATYDIDMDLARGFPRDLCRRWCVLPFDRMSKSVFVATANPFNQEAARELAQSTSSRLVYYLVPPTDLLRILRRAFR